MLLTKKSGAAQAPRSPFVHSLQRGLAAAIPTMDRRSFLRRSGLGVGVGLAASSLTLVKKARAADGKGPGVGDGRIEVKRTVCSHCSVGCAVDAVVENGVWVRQEPVFDSPINLGAHCAKGAAIREHGHGERDIGGGGDRPAVQRALASAPCDGGEDQRGRRHAADCRSDRQRCTPRVAQVAGDELPLQL